MIKLREDTSQKAVGSTSIWLQSDYNPAIVQIMQQTDGAMWNKSLKQWEFPISSLASCVDRLAMIDDIELQTIPNKKATLAKPTLHYKTQPFDYQMEGIEYGLNHDKWLLLFEPGLGKTLVTTYIAEELQAMGKVNHCLVVCGINTLKSNWKREINQHSNLDCVIIGTRINKKGKAVSTTIKRRVEQLMRPIDQFFIIINIESLRDADIIKALQKGPNKIDMILLDECHKVSNPTSQQTKGLLKLKATYQIAMTGTLLVNSPLDAYVPLKWINQEHSTWGTFKSNYCIFDHWYNQIVGYKNVDQLQYNIDQCGLRKTKDILNLPPKIIVPEYLEMSESQAKFYEEVSLGIADEVDKVTLSTAKILSLITRLRQASTCPSALSTTQTESVKINRALELIDEITSNHQKVVIFSTFKESLNQLYQQIPDKSRVRLCTGDRTDQYIDEAVHQFQTNDNVDIMLATAQKMGTGITLTAASYEIFLDSNWTAAVESQCEDRCHRVGTKSSVIIYKLIAANTFDERMQQIVGSKKGVSDYIVDHHISQSEQVLELLGIKQNKLL